MTEQIAQFAKVARPAMGLKPGVNVRVYPQLGKHVRKILQTLAKVRQAKLKGSDPSVKLMAETAGGHKPAQGNVAGSNQAGFTSRAAVEVLQAHKKLILRRWPESSNMLQVKAAEAQLLGCARGELLRRASRRKAPKRPAKGGAARGRPPTCRCPALPSAKQCGSAVQCVGLERGVALQRRFPRQIPSDLVVRCSSWPGGFIGGDGPDLKRDKTPG